MGEMTLTGDKTEKMPHPHGDIVHRHVHKV